VLQTHRLCLIVWGSLMCDKETQRFQTVPTAAGHVPTGNAAQTTACSSPFVLSYDCCIHFNNLIDTHLSVKIKIPKQLVMK